MDVSWRAHIPVRTSVFVFFIDNSHFYSAKSYISQSYAIAL